MEVRFDVYPVLKRSDEKWVTERAYDNPRLRGGPGARSLRQSPQVTTLRRLMYTIRAACITRCV